MDRSLISRSTLALAMPCHAHPPALRSAPAAGELCPARGARRIGGQESAEMPQGATIYPGIPGIPWILWILWRPWSKSPCFKKMGKLLSLYWDAMGIVEGDDRTS